MIGREGIVLAPIFVLALVNLLLLGSLGGQGVSRPGDPSPFVLIAGAIRVLTSADGNAWASAALIVSKRVDLPDPKITLTPDNRLMLTAAAVTLEGSARHYQTMTYFSDDRRTWSEGVPIGEPDVWLWPLTWHKGVAYAVGYAAVDVPSRFIRSYRSRDGRNFEILVDNMSEEGYPSETSLVFLEDDTCLCLLRRGGAALQA